MESKAQGEGDLGGSLPGSGMGDLDGSLALTEPRTAPKRQSPTVTVTIETAKVYRLRKFKPESFCWADITIRSWKNGGAIDVQSDYGSYAYQWNATGCDDIREFLVRLDYGYFMGKAHPSHGYETDWEAPADALKREVLKDRRGNDLKADAARECFDAIDRIDKDDGFFWQAREYPELYDFLNRCEYHKETRRSPQCSGFWTIIWSEITRVWRQELEPVGLGEGASPEPSNPSRNTQVTPTETKGELTP